MELKPLHIDVPFLDVLIRGGGILAPDFAEIDLPRSFVPRFQERNSTDFGESRSEAGVSRGEAARRSRR